MILDSDHHILLFQMNDYNFSFLFSLRRKFSNSFYTKMFSNEIKNFRNCILYFKFKVYSFVKPFVKLTQLTASFQSQHWPPKVLVIYLLIFKVCVCSLNVLLHLQVLDSWIKYFLLSLRIVTLFLKFSMIISVFPNFFSFFFSSVFWFLFCTLEFLFPQISVYPSLTSQT